MITRQALLLVAVVFTVACGTGTAVWALTSTREDVSSNAEAIEQARNAARAASLAVRQIRRESSTRRQQTCALFERQHLADVDALKQSYRFLRRLSREEYGTALAVTAVRQLPMLERAARVDSAPEYCDAPGVGLPEPDPTLPKRRDFSDLLHRP